ncbi:MAG: BON domain-containing protein, partial [Betaproteobacteria bacterium]|nr:BON domain-containing protein [Betaproteobacteria bacterium]
RRSEWLTPFARSLTPHTARKTSTLAGCGKIARSRRRAPRHRSPGRSPDTERRSRLAREGLPAAAPAIGCCAVTCRSRHLRRAPCDHRDSASNAAHGGLVQCFLKFAIAGSFFLCLVQPSLAFDPVTTLAGSAISTAMDVRSKSEVKNDVEIDITATKLLLENKGDDLKGVSLLVFAQRAVLVGLVKSEEAKRKAAKLLGKDKRIRSLQNEIIVSATESGGSMVSNLLLEKKIGATLTVAQGVHSVNMRWKAVGGRVVLMGVAKSRAEADLAVSKIKGLDGVKSVKSRLRVSDGK